MNKLTAALVTKKFNEAVVHSKIIYSTLDSLMYYSRMLDASPALEQCVTELFLVSDTLMSPHHGLQYQFTQLETQLRMSFEQSEWNALDDISELHESAVIVNNAWITQGGYRSALRDIINRLPNLTHVHVRNMQVRNSSLYYLTDS